MKFIGGWPQPIISRSMAGTVTGWEPRPIISRSGGRLCQPRPIISRSGGWEIKKDFCSRFLWDKSLYFCGTTLIGAMRPPCSVHYHARSLDNGWRSRQALLTSACSLLLSSCPLKSIRPSISYCNPTICSSL
jgi:hypothetical protein